MMSKVKARVEQYKLLYEQGFTLHEIAERFNRTYNAVTYLLISHGCMLRNPKAEAQIQRIRHKKEILGLIESRNVKLSETLKAPRLREIEDKLRKPVKQ